MPYHKFRLLSAPLAPFDVLLFRCLLFISVHCIQFEHFVCFHFKFNAVMGVNDSHRGSTGNLFLEYCEKKGEKEKR